MKYMVLLYQDPANFPTDPAGFQKLSADYETFTQSVKGSGAYVDGWPLTPTPDQIRTVKGNGVASGPPHARPQALIGYYVLDYGNIDEATKAAAHIPNVPAGGSVEVVPFMEM